VAKLPAESFPQEVAVHDVTPLYLKWQPNASIEGAECKSPHLYIL
jgi:hypothetical protein